MRKEHAGVFHGMCEWHLGHSLDHFLLLGRVKTRSARCASRPNNHTGTATFTASNQAYWEYREIVSPGNQSSTVTWIFNVPTTVTAWNYTIGVSAPLQHPNGWIDVSGDTQIPHGLGKEHTAVVRTWTGAVDNSGSVSWTSTDEGGYVYVSSLDERVGYVLGVRLGYATVTASKGSATPRTRTVYVY
jgi:hypothetical protein